MNDKHADMASAQLCAYCEAMAQALCDANQSVQILVQPCVHRGVAALAAVSLGTIVRWELHGPMTLEELSAWALRMKASIDGITKVPEGTTRQ